jgi:hypothetical protein
VPLRGSARVVRALLLDPDIDVRCVFLAKVWGDPGCALAGLLLAFLDVVPPFSNFLIVLF